MREPKTVKTRSHRKRRKGRVRYFAGTERTVAQNIQKSRHRYGLCHIAREEGGMQTVAKQRSLSPRLAWGH